MKLPALRIGLVTLAYLGSSSALSVAADSKGPAHEPAARQLFDEVVKAYRSLDAYTDQGEFVAAMTLDGRSETQKTPLHLSFARPNRVSVDAGPIRLVSDGTTLTSLVTPLKRFETRPAPKAIDLETFHTGPAGAMLFGGPAAPVTFVLASLLVDPHAAESVLREFAATLKNDADRESGGKPHRVIRIVCGDGSEIRLLVDPATKLVREIDLVVNAKKMSDTLGASVVVNRLGWTSGPISTAQPGPDAFAFKPPKLFSKIDPFSVAAGAAAAGPAKFRVVDLVGKPAPQFVLTVLDGADKLKLITKADLAGKVVVLDFWATWCEPCMRELPDIQKVVERFAKENKEVVVIAVSGDERPSEIRDVRKLVESTLKRQSITLTAGAVGKIALDPSGTVRDAFEVEGFPTLVIIDAKGTIQSAHVGQADDIRETLARDVDTLLQGKSLVKDAKGEK